MRYEAKQFIGTLPEIEESISAWLNTLPDRVLSRPNAGWMFGLTDPQPDPRNHSGFEVRGWAIIREENA